LNAAGGKEVATTEPQSAPVSEPAPETAISRKAIALWVIGGLAIALLIVAALASQNPASTTSPPSQPSWHFVSTYSGNGYDSNGMPVATNNYTTTFNIKGSSFKLDWSYTSYDPYEQTFAVYDYPSLHYYSDGTPLPVICQTSDYTTASPGCNFTTDSSNSGTENLSQGPGTFYLQVIGTLRSWSITVEDYY